MLGPQWGVGEIACPWHHLNFPVFQDPAKKLLHLLPLRLAVVFFLLFVFFLLIVKFFLPVLGMYALLLQSTVASWGHNRTSHTRNL